MSPRLSVFFLQICAVQLGKDLAGVSAEEMDKIVIAYEPVSRKLFALVTISGLNPRQKYAYL